MFKPMRIMTDYTLMGSMITIPKLIKYLNANNIHTCGICDNNLFGVMEFYETCTSNNIKPIIGLLLTINDIEISIYAKDYEGYKSLLKIHTLKEKKG